MKKLVLIIPFLIVAISGYAQTKPSEVNELSYLIGKWKTVTKAMTKSGEWKEVATNTAQFAFIKKESYIKGDMGGQYDYELIYSYDRFQNKYRMSSIDQVSGLLDIYEGDLEEGKLVVDNVLKDTHYTWSGKKYHNRLTLSKTSANEAFMLIEGSDNRGEKWQQISQVLFFKL
jgi:Protein of unknown function (DUF1579)